MITLANNKYIPAELLESDVQNFVTWNFTLITSDYTTLGPESFIETPLDYHYCNITDKEKFFPYPDETSEVFESVYGQFLCLDNVDSITLYGSDYSVR